MFYALKNGFDAVVIFMADGVKLMSMASSAVDGQPKKGLPHDPDQIFQFVFARNGALSCIGLTVARLIPRSTHQQTGCDDTVLGDWLDRITRDLFSHELRVGFVLVEAFDHIVAVVPSVFANAIVFKALTFCITSHVQPMPTPSLAIMRRGKKSFYLLFISARGFILDKGVQLFGGRWKPDQVKTQSSQQCLAVC